MPYTLEHLASEVRPETTFQRNRRVSKEEVARFLSDPPSQLVAYLRPRHGVSQARAGDEVTTWNGDRLGVIISTGTLWRSNLGDQRQYVRVLGINGVSYGGTAYFSSGDLVRLRPIKTKGAS